MADDYRPNFRLFRHRMTVQEPGTPVPDGKGGETPSLTTVGTFWARKRPLSGREVFNARQIKATSTHAIETRASTPVTPTSILTFFDDGEVYHVDSALTDEWGAYTTIQATLQTGESPP